MGIGAVAAGGDAFRRGWRSQNLSGKKCPQILAVAYHRNRNVRKSNVAPIYLSATSRATPLFCRNVRAGTGLFLVSAETVNQIAEQRTWGIAVRSRASRRLQFEDTERSRAACHVDPFHPPRDDRARFCLPRVRERGRRPNFEPVSVERGVRAGSRVERANLALDRRRRLSPTASNWAGRAVRPRTVSST